MNKRFFAVSAAAAIACGFCSVSASAASGTSGDFTVDRTYSYGGYTVKVTKYSGRDTDITLPSSVEINGTEYAVESTGTALQKNEYITSVIIPEGYTEIEAAAFSGCTALEKVVIPGSVTMISSNAFSGCTALSEVVFEADTASRLNIMNAVFSECTSLKSLNVPARLTSSNYDFAQNSAVEEITVNGESETAKSVDGVLYLINDGEAKLLAYPDAKTDNEFIVPAEVAGCPVTEIAMHAFRYSQSLETLTVPSSVSTIGGFAFAEMSAAKEIILEEENAPELGTYVFDQLPSDCKITVKNRAVADVISAAADVTVEVEGEGTTEPEPTGKVSAQLLIEADETLSNSSGVVYNIYLTKAENVSTILFKTELDASQAGEGTLEVRSNAFDVVNTEWSSTDGKRTLTAYIGKTGDEKGFSSSDAVLLAVLTVPLENNAAGSVKAQLTAAKCAGVISAGSAAVNGEITLGIAAAEHFITSYDVNRDGKIDVVDLAEAQRYYRASKNDADWSGTRAADVNNDGVVDISDYIEIFNNLSDF